MVLHVLCQRNRRRDKGKSKDELYGYMYMLLLFKLSLLHKNLDDKKIIEYMQWKPPYDFLNYCHPYREGLLRPTFL